MAHSTHRSVQKVSNDTEDFEQRCQLEQTFIYGTQQAL